MGLLSNSLCLSSLLGCPGIPLKFLFLAFLFWHKDQELCRKKQSRSSQLKKLFW